MENRDYELNKLIRTGTIPELRAAFERDPSLGLARPYGQSLPLLAVLEGRLDVLDFLIAAGCDLQSGDDESGLMPLHAAALNNNLAAARALLDAGAPVDGLDQYGNTPLFRAVYAYTGDLALIKLLLEHDADPLHANHSGATARDMAEHKRDPALLALLSKR